MPGEMERPGKADVRVLVWVILGAACIHRPPSREHRTRTEDSCRSAAAQVSDGGDSFGAFATLGWCDESGPAPIAARWHRTLPNDSLALRALLFASANLRDGRIFDAAFYAVVDSTRPEYERGAALLVLAAQCDASAALILRPATRGTPWRVELGRSSHVLQLTGPNPLPPDARHRVAALVASILDRPPGGIRRSLRTAVRSSALNA